MILEATAEYIPDGDTVLAVAYVYDPTNSTYHPEHVQAGTVVLRSMGRAIGPTIRFDRRMGNADGSFKFTFAHPSKVKNLELFVTADLFDGTSYQQSAPVTLTKEDGIPLVPNPMSEPDTLSQVRVEEEHL